MLLSPLMLARPGATFQHATGVYAFMYVCVCRRTHSSTHIRTHTHTHAYILILQGCPQSWPLIILLPSPPLLFARLSFLHSVVRESACVAITVGRSLLPMGRSLLPDPQASFDTLTRDPQNTRLLCVPHTLFHALCLTACARC